MAEYRRTWEIKDIAWNKLFSLYEYEYRCRIDPAVPQAWWEENKDDTGRRHGACWVYYEDGGIGGEPLFRDELLRRLGISLGHEEIA